MEMTHRQKVGFVKIELGLSLSVILFVIWYYLLTRFNSPWYTGYIAVYARIICFYFISAGIYNYFKQILFIVIRWFWGTVFLLYASNNILQIMDEKFKGNGIFDDMMHVDRMLIFVFLFMLIFYIKCRFLYSK